MEDSLASPVVGVLIWLLGAAIPGVAGFWLGGRLVRRGGVVALLIGFSSVVTVVSFDPVTSAFDHADEDDDLGGIGYWVLLAWMLLWFAVCLVTGWLRMRRRVDSA